MSTNEVYEFIGDLAIALYSKKFRLAFHRLIKYWKIKDGGMAIIEVWLPVYQLLTDIGKRKTL